MHFKLIWFLWGVFQMSQETGGGPEDLASIFL